MIENSLVLNRVQVVQGFAPVGLTTNAGTPVSLANYRRCLIVFIQAAADHTDVPTLTILQGTNVAFGTNKALNFTDVYVKEATALATVGQWTHVTQSPGNTFTDATTGLQERMWAVEFKAEDLDIENNYSCIKASIGEAGSNAAVGFLWYTLTDPYFAKKPEEMASAVVD